MVGPVNKKDHHNAGGIHIGGKDKGSVTCKNAKVEKSSVKESTKNADNSSENQKCSRNDNKGNVGGLHVKGNNDKDINC
uniref:Uncharacterized protein n=1 Tax=Panagrolaimus sp. PS1159 TaxID=55785 RepID=A0AC35GXI3_9BILA